MINLQIPHKYRLYIYIYIYSLWSVRFLMFFKEVSYVHKDCIYLIKNTEKKSNIVQYFYDLKWLFSILIYFKIKFLSDSKLNIHPLLLQPFLRSLVYKILQKKKKYRRSVAKLKLSHWCHMDCFTDVLTTFLDLGTLQLRCYIWRVWEVSDLIKNILICVPKMNEGLTGLERHEVEPFKTGVMMLN